MKIISRKFFQKLTRVPRLNHYQRICYMNSFDFLTFKWGSHTIGIFFISCRQHEFFNSFVNKNQEIEQIFYCFELYKNVKNSDVNAKALTMSFLAIKLDCFTYFFRFKFIRIHNQNINGAFKKTGKKLKTLFWKRKIKNISRCSHRNLKFIIVTFIYHVINI